jgi:hypothetical protein
VAALRRIDVAIGDGSLHPDLSGLKINVLPLEAKRFSDAHACPRQQKKEGVVPPVMRGGLWSRGGDQKGGHLLSNQEVGRAGECSCVVASRPQFNLAGGGRQ